MKRSRCKGQSLVETSLIVVAFLSLLLGMVGIGQALFVRQTFSERVHAAARWGANVPGPAPAPGSAPESAPAAKLPGSPEPGGVPDPAGVLEPARSAGPRSA